MHITLLILDFELCAIIREDTATTTTTLSQIALQRNFHTFCSFTLHEHYCNVTLLFHDLDDDSLSLTAVSLASSKKHKKSKIHRFLLKLSTK
jgi:hypothetical protein